MKQIHPLSLVLGLTIAVVCMITMSQLTVTPARVDPYTPPCTMQVEYGPHARDMVQIEEGVPFVVPPARLFVPTALGCLCSTAAPVFLLFDGQTKVYANSYANGTSMSPLATGLVAHSGSTVVVGTFGASGRAWGYLVTQ